MLVKISDKIKSLIIDAEQFILKLKSAEKSIQARLDLRKGEYSAYMATVLNFLLIIFKANNPYIEEYKENAKLYNIQGVQNGINILERILIDFKEGWTQSILGIVSAEIFSNFLDMAEHLIQEKYKDAAAVIVGAVVEEHLRNLCSKHAIPTDAIDNKGKTQTKKSSIMNEDLLRAGVYNLLEYKAVMVFLDLRNKAAHGKYTEYDLNHVTTLHRSVKDFIMRNKL